MLFETLGQARVFLAMAGCGAAAAALYDLMSLARRGQSRGAWIMEVLFALAAGAMLFAAMARTGQGSLRGYVLLGAAVGWFLYAASVSVILKWIGGKFRTFWRKMRRVHG